MSTVDPQHGRRARVPRFVLVLVAIGLLWGAWQLVMAGVRAWVDHRVESVEGAELVDFELQDLDGRTWRAEDLRGQVTVLHFFRSHCSRCLAEREAVARLEERLDPDRARLFGVLLDRVEGYAPEVTRRTLEALRYEHPVLVADEAFVDRFHGAGWAHVTPITYVVDADGRVRAALRGRQSFESLTAALPAGALR